MEMSHVKIASTVIAISVFTLLPLVAQEYRGTIAGKVVDAKTQEPLYGVNVVVASLEHTGASTDEQGNFTVRNIDVGTYSLRVSAIGYQTRIVTNVVVSTGRPSPVMIRLDEEVIQTQEVTIKGRYYSKEHLLAPLSTNVFDRSEIRRLPGSVQDVQRVVQNLPGVASSTDNINELIVRGGAPFENLTILDQMEIPSINHYSNQMNSAGPINMVNADMIEDVQFSAGGFPVQYGDKSSSVMALTVREGNRQATLSGTTGFNMAGVGLLAEGGFADGKGSYILSARKSLLEVVDQIVGISSISLTAIPKYWDTQSKIVYDLSPSNKLMFNILYGESRINIVGDPKEYDGTKRSTADSSSLEYLHPYNSTYAAGVTLRTLYDKQGFSNLTLYTSGSRNEVTVRQDYVRRAIDAVGNVTDHQLLNSRILYRETSRESYLALKYELFYQIHPQHGVSAGGQYQTVGSWNNDAWIVGDTLQYDFNRDGSFDLPLVIVPDGYFSQSLKLGSVSRSYAYLSDKYRVLPDLALTAGLRYDYFSYSKKGSLSPRLSLAYQVLPTTTVTLAWGHYYQSQPLPYYGDRSNSSINNSLESMKSIHYVAGVDHFFGEGLKLSLEAYYKTYSDVAYEEQFIYSAMDTNFSDKRLPVGKRRSYGVELYLEQKQIGDFYGAASVSLSKTEDKDPRIPPLVDWYRSDYDYPVIITVYGGKVVRGAREWLDEAPFYIKYPSYILPLSNEMELSFKYRYQTGRPYTPVEFATWKQYHEGGVRWTGGMWDTSDRINSARYSDYSRFDIQWISRFYYETWNINVFVSINNVFNTKNVFFESLRSDGTKETVYQFAFFPVAGVEVEF